MTIGGLLHDIGTYRVLKHDGSDGEPLQFDGKRYILYGLLGYEYLLEQGVDESIAQFARNHTGVGLTQQMVIAQNLPLPPVDYMPVNLEQEIVMVADKYNSKSIPPKFLTAQAYAKRAERYGEANKRRWLDLVDQVRCPRRAGPGREVPHAHDLGGIEYAPAWVDSPVDCPPSEGVSDEAVYSLMMVSAMLATASDR